MRFAVRVLIACFTAAGATNPAQAGFGDGPSSNAVLLFIPCCGVLAVAGFILGCSLLYAVLRRISPQPQPTSEKPK
jgi:hypothetical protein